MNALTRRQFLRILAVGSGAASLSLLSGCYSSAPTPASTAAPTTAPATAATAAAAATKAPQAAATQAPATKEQVTLRYTDWQLAEEPTGTAYRKVVTDFMADHSNVKIEMEPVPLAQYPTRIATQAKAGQLADIVHVYDPWLANWVKEGFLMSLEPLVQKEGGDAYKNQFFADAIKVGTFNGQLYANPGYVTPLNLQYNVELFEKAGLDPNKPPVTWQEFLEYAQKLTKPDGSQYGAAIHGAKQSSAVTRFVTWLFNNDASVISEDAKKVLINEPKAIETLDFWTSLALKHKVTPPGVTEIDVQNGRSLFAQEKVAMFQNVATAAYLVAAENPKIKPKIRIAGMPTQVGKSWTPQFMSFLTIAATTKQTETAWEFIKYFTSRDKWVQSWSIAGMMPGRLDAYTDPALQADPVAKVAQGLAKNVKFIPPIPEWSQISDSVGNAIQLTLGGSKTPAQAFGDAAGEITKILKL